MSFGFFIVGFVIFSIYVFFLINTIFTQNKKQREENYPNVDIVDMDGMGNYGRIPNKKPKYVSKRSNVSGRRSVQKGKI